MAYSAKLSSRQLAQLTKWIWLTRIFEPPCVYCGQRATTIDHFPPIAATPRVGIILHACRDCNVGLQDFYAKARISRKYAKILKMPPWSAEELDGLTGGLRRKMLRWQRENRIAHARLAWDAMAYLRRLVSMPSFALRGVDNVPTRDTVVSLLKLFP